jgi:hypothetical protein
VQPGVGGGEAARQAADDSVKFWHFFCQNSKIWPVNLAESRPEFFEISEFRLIQ